MGIDPHDAVEGMLGAQLIAANAAALELYRLAWVPEQSFEVSTRFLALADKAARTIALLSEALDRHRGKGQQQITVKHVTVNADQAVVADTVVTGSKAPEGGSDQAVVADTVVGASPEGGSHGSIKSGPLLEARDAPSSPLQSAVEEDREAVPLARR
jgi:hypothetical protein